MTSNRVAYSMVKKRGDPAVLRIVDYKTCLDAADVKRLPGEGLDREPQLIGLRHVFRIVDSDELPAGEWQCDVGGARLGAGARRVARQ